MDLNISAQVFVDCTQYFWSIDGSGGFRKQRVNHLGPYREEIPIRIIQLFSLNNDLIVSPFSGSSINLEAAWPVKWKSLGIERDPEFNSSFIHKIKEDLSIDYGYFS